MQLGPGSGAICNGTANNPHSATAVKNMLRR
jgi:hypothetical protein